MILLKCQTAITKYNNKEYLGWRFFFSHKVLNPKSEIFSWPQNTKNVDIKSGLQGKLTQSMGSHHEEGSRCPVIQFFHCYKDA